MGRKVASGPGLLIGIPTLGRPVTLDWAMAYKALNPPINYNVNTTIVYGKPVAEARNEICQQALEMGHKYVFFLGDDVIPPFHTLKQLIFRMENQDDLGVVGGVYFSKCDPSAPLVFKENGCGSFWDWKVGEYFEVTGLGMDCTMIRVKLLEELEGEWFKTIDDDNFLDGENHALQWTEDLYFCKRVYEETNWKIYADGSLICRHVDVYTGRTYTVPNNSKLLLRRKTEEDLKKALDIGSGYRPIELEGYDVVTVDIDPEKQPDYVCDARILPFDNEQFDLVHSSHVLEHFPRRQVSDVLDEWIRVLKKGGKLILQLPDLLWALEHLQESENEINVMNVFYGAQVDEFDFHKVGFWPQRIKNLLEGKGIKVERCGRSEPDSYNLVVEGIKE